MRERRPTRKLHPAPCLKHQSSGANPRDQVSHKRVRFRRVANAVLGCAAWALTGVAAAQTAAPTAPVLESANAWHVRASIMGYFPAVYGRTQFPGGNSGPGFRINPHTILRSLNFGFMGELHVTKGPWGALLHVRYTDLSKHLHGTHDLGAPGVPVPVGVTGDFGLGAKTTLMTLAGTYQAIASPQSDFYLLAGARLLRDRQRLDYHLSAPIAGMARDGISHANSTHWDGVIGVMGRQRLVQAPHWFIPYYLDVGAGDSRFTMQASLGVGYAFGWGEVSAAWRYVDYRYKGGTGVSRLRYTGPTVGMTWTF